MAQKQTKKDIAFVQRICMMYLAMTKKTQNTVRNDAAENTLSDVDVYRVDHLPIISAFCQRIDLIDTVNRLVPSQMAVDPGTIVQALVLDTLSGRNPLYRLEEFFELQNVEQLLGKDLPKSTFSDVNIGRTFDRIHRAGTSKVFSEVAVQACRNFNVRSRHAHFDTTSVNVWGDYNLAGNATEGLAGLKILHGHSKDKRDDLKQFMLQALCVDKNIPILGGCEDGNASDRKINHRVLSSIKAHMARHGLEPGAFVYVADSAMVTQYNLEEMGQNLFITRLPFTYDECGRAVAQAVEQDSWEDLGRMAVTKPTKNRPVASYKVSEGEVVLYEKTYRVVVVQSDALDKRRQKKLQRELEASRVELKNKIEKKTKEKYFCEPDALAACAALRREDSKYHGISAEVLSVPLYARGRPAKGKPRAIKATQYCISAKLVEKRDAIDKRKKEAGCFVLLTNVPTTGEMAHTGKETLRAYKDQYGIERNFGFLKDPLIVNDLFLKCPERIETLGMILLISLLVWNLIERELRLYIEQGHTLPGWAKRKTTRPTTFMMTTKMAGIIVMMFAGQRRFNKPLKSIQQAYLTALGMTEEEFLNPVTAVANPP